MRLVILLFLLLGVGAAPTFAQEDILLLKDGRIFDQLNIERTADGILVHYKTADIAVPLVFIEDVLLFGEEHAPFEPTTEEERTRVEEGLIPFEGK